MTNIKIVVVTLMLIALAVPALAKTYKNTYPVTCNHVWSAVKETLSNEGNYKIQSSDDAQMTAVYQPKHSVHVDISGVLLLQRLNHVILVSKGAGCEMQVVSNYSGWGHEDQGDFKKQIGRAHV